jgi:hypothetical protein
MEERLGSWTAPLRAWPSFDAALASRQAKYWWCQQDDRLLKSGSTIGVFAQATVRSGTWGLQHFPFTLI